MSETRKLAAIVCSDVVGYSRLAGADEDRVLAQLRAPLSDLIDPTIRSPSQAHGRRLDRRIPRRRRRRSLRQRSSDRHSRTQRRCAPECRPSDAYWLSHQYSSERPGGGQRCRPMGDGVNIAASHFLIQAASSASAPPFRGAHPLRTFGLLINRWIFVAGDKWSRGTRALRAVPCPALKRMIERCHLRIAQQPGNLA
jgi:hypothetical protein